MHKLEFLFFPAFWGKSDHNHHWIKPLSKEWKQQQQRKWEKMSKSLTFFSFLPKEITEFSLFRGKTPWRGTPRLRISPGMCWTSATRCCPTSTRWCTTPPPTAAQLCARCSTSECGLLPPQNPTFLPQTRCVAPNPPRRAASWGFEWEFGAQEQIWDSNVDLGVRCKFGVRRWIWN